ncbi:MAG: PH domain-containing protein [Burkholderiales bacterium]|nr:PH domain-containing protein [Burkholderiales bacterium]
MAFPSKIDAWLFVVLVAAAGVCAVAAAAALRQASGMALLALLFILAIGATLPVWILVSTNYSVQGSTLHVRSGPFAWHIPVSAITSIKPTHSPLSSPALSLRRLRVEYGHGKCILVSPVDQQAFISAVESAKNAT